LGDKNTVFSDEEKRKFMEIADQESVIDDLVMSFAPSIYGHE
jgi:DNA replicative helicase MCM subunit Mcm2 (Cdc46/Mcm family)